MTIDHKTLNRDDLPADTVIPEEVLYEGEKFEEGAPEPADKTQLELDKLHAAAENPFSPDSIAGADSEEERARQRREQGIVTDADISTDGG